MSLGPILTSRGAAILLLGLFLFLGPGQSEADLVAATLGQFIFWLTLISAFVVLKLSITIRDKSTTSISAPEGIKGDVDRLIALSPVLVLVKLSRILIPPLFYIKIKVNYSKNFYSSNIIFTGLVSEKSPVSLKFSFPHRGRWQISSTHFEVSDFLGLCKTRFIIPAQESPGIDVLPAPTNIPDIPILSSSSEPGDTIPHDLNRTGDRFDITAYNPSEGANRIVWKAFARRGELIVRHPEAAISPEGTTLVYLLADKHDDASCYVALNYLEKIINFDISFIFGCEGMASSKSSLNLDESEKLCLLSVWNSGGETEELVHTELKGFISGAKDILKDSVIRNVVVFASTGRLKRNPRILEYLGEGLQSLDIIPNFVVVNNSIFQAEQNKKRLFMRKNPRLSDAELSKISLNKFLLRASGSKWQVLNEPFSS